MKSLMLHSQFDAFTDVNGSFEIDAAFLDYQFNDTISFSAGKMYSLLLYETYRPHSMLVDSIVPIPTR